MSQLQEVLEHYGVRVLDRTTQMVLCPMGHESNPSCAVDLDKGLYHCHSCGAAGDAISLIRAKEHCDYATSVRRLTEITGTGNGEVRAAPGRGGRVAPGKGFRPRFRRAVPARRRYDA